MILEDIEGLDAPSRRKDGPFTGFGALAARAFAESDVATVNLFARWVSWLAAFDDLRDDTGLGTSPVALSAMYKELLSTVDGQSRHPRFGPLWRATASRCGPAWRQRFRRDLLLHWHGSLHEAANRRSGRIPAPQEFVQLRRITNGAIVFLLFEPMLRIEVPPAVAESRPWRSLVQAANDVTAWCNDLASAYREERHNYVHVLTHHLRCSVAEAEAQVRQRIASRMADLHAAARVLPEEFERQNLDRATSCALSRVAVTYLGAPRGHLEWLHESPRYTA
ncbi:terpene synthase family protein [Catelliglobosispora koreensis]|uniref:terpene synthase family protein n=1 Tax=Catelliglobosispora koreensis TaxID=129052 RepID=UPI00036C4E06|nr:terpene synthase family protein [Catelliglobosispora koreensis]